VAAALQQELGIASELVVGKSGEFTVWLGERLIAEKNHTGFPDPDDVVDDVRDAMGCSESARALALRAT
jgi:predicted Rdx family selenoprotein